MNNVIEELENDITEFISSTANLSPSDEPTVGTEAGPDESLTSGEDQIIEQMDGDIADSTQIGNELRHRKVHTTPEDKEIKNERELTIKLKYLNDELKLVTAKATEAIGDFKK